MTGHGLDAIDIRILDAVQRHGRLSKAELAQTVGLSPTPCWTRLARLKAAGLVRGYRAEIALDRLADITQVVVTVSLAHHRKGDFDRFERHIRSVDAVTDCVATGGGTDYVLTVACRNLTAFQGVMDDLLAAELGIERWITYIVSRHVKHTAPDLASLVDAAK